MELMCLQLHIARNAPRRLASGGPTELRIYTDLSARGATPSREQRRLKPRPELITVG
jgi:hypothetical protein